MDLFIPMLAFGRLMLPLRIFLFSWLFIKKIWRWMNNTGYWDPSWSGKHLNQQTQ